MPSVPIPPRYGRSVLVGPRKAFVRGVDRAGAHRGKCGLRVDAVQEWHQHGVLHELVDLRHSLIQCFRLGRQIFHRKVEKRIANIRVQIHFARTVWPNVRIHESSPQCFHVVSILARRLTIRSSPCHHFRIVFLISPSVHGKFQRLQAVIIRQIRHKGRECPWRFRGIGEYFSQVRSSRAVRAMYASRFGYRHGQRP